MRWARSTAARPESPRPSAPAPPTRAYPARIPYAADVDAHLDAIKRQQRDSIASYTEAHADVTAVREAYERELLAAGAGELIRGAVSDATGRLRLEGVPAGEWLLLGWREESHAVKAARTPAKDSGRFATAPTMTGFGAVSYWRMALAAAERGNDGEEPERSRLAHRGARKFTYPTRGSRSPGRLKNAVREHPPGAHSGFTRSAAG